MILTEDKLKQIAPNCPDIVSWTAAINFAMDKYQINNVQRVSAFLAQVMHESGQCKTLSENLNYTAPRLMVVWPSRFPNIGVARQYEKNPQKLANKVYANRLGNGDEASGDGWKYRGKGLIQLTGKDNYIRIGKDIGLDLVNNPDLLLQPNGAALSTASFWSSKKLNYQADLNTNLSFDNISVAINGGKIGLDERRKYWEKIKKILIP